MRKLILIISIIVFTFPAAAYTVAPATDDFPHYELFDTVLNTLCDNFWQENGDWLGDMMHDATAFAPYVLINWGDEIGDEDLFHKGWTTVHWEDQCIENWIQNPDDPIMAYKATVGYPAYLFTYDYAGSRFYLFRVRPILKLLTDTALIVPDLFEKIPYFSAPTMFGAISYADFLLYYDDPILNLLYNLRGMLVLDKSKELYFNEELGLYQTRPGYVHDYDWPNGMMLLGLAWGYKTTGIFYYKAEALALADAIEDNIGDPENGGYFSDLYNGSPRTKYLSGNMTILWGLLTLYEIDRDPGILDRIEHLLEFVENDLFYDGLCYHHWTEGSGRADYFCTGCNFLLLDNLYNYHIIAEE